MAKIKEVDACYYYTDTDSIVVNESDLFKFSHLLDDSLLGYLKVVYKIKEALFLSPKTYCFNLKTNNTLIVKNKGVSLGTSYSLSKLYNLFMFIFENNIKYYSFLDNKLFKKSLDSFLIKDKFDQDVTVNFDFDKRIKIYNKRGEWVGTKPRKMKIKKKI